MGGESYPEGDLMPTRLLVADDDRGFCQQIAEAVASDSKLELLDIVHDGKSTLEVLERETPDVLLLDLVMPELDGIGVLEAIQRDRGDLRILVMSVFGQEEILSRVLSLGADYFIVKPFDVKLLLQRAKELAQGSKFYDGQVYNRRSNQMEAEIVRQLIQCGVPAHYKGYAYLKEGIIRVIQDGSLINRVTKELYPAIAREFNTTAEKVERAIRHAIETAYIRGNIEFLNEVFAYTVDSQKGKPTNSSFIATLADRIRLGIKVAE
jgi:two-component system response regulator (stage 0 sporulation protein A)